MADKPDLNSLNRFRKRPGRLVLEAHGHCEVPAGCGGVVLRWRNPHAIQPVMMWLWTPVKPACFIDGVAQNRIRFDLSPGRHAFAATLPSPPLTAGLILLWIGPGDDVGQPGEPTDVTERAWTCVTADDGTWRFRLDDPGGDDWMTTAFDDRDWPALVEAPAPQLERGEEGAYQSARCLEHGAICLGLAPAARAGATTPTVHIRKVFDVPVPE
jgi:hypothetical protein